MESSFKKYFVFSVSYEADEETGTVSVKASETFALLQ